MQNEVNPARYSFFHMQTSPSKDARENASGKRVVSRPWSYLREWKAWSSASTTASAPALETAQSSLHRTGNKGDDSRASHETGFRVRASLMPASSTRTGGWLLRLRLVRKGYLKMGLGSG